MTDVEIKQAFFTPKGSIMGLGDDNKVYFWSWDRGDWQLHSKAGRQAREAEKEVSDF